MDMMETVNVSLSTLPVYKDLLRHGHYWTFKCRVYIVDIYVPYAITLTVSYMAFQADFGKTVLLRICSVFGNS